MDQVNHLKKWVNEFGGSGRGEKSKCDANKENVENHSDVWEWTTGLKCDYKHVRIARNISTVRNIRLIAKLSQKINIFLELAIRRETRAERTRRARSEDARSSNNLEQLIMS